MRPSREERHARMKLSEVYEIFIEAKRAKRRDDERKCFIDTQGNPTVDPDMVDFKALVAAIPTGGVYPAKIRENPNYKKEAEEGIRKVFFASVEKKKHVEEILEVTTQLSRLIMLSQLIKLMKAITNLKTKLMSSAGNAWKHAVPVLKRVKI
ncbi:hypothetical protein Hanom_Chr13g01201611 [Helianthus anomalus]